MKRILLFVATNIAVLFVLSISASILIRVLGIQEIPGGLNLQALIIFAAVIGFGGSFISLAMSKWMAKRATGAHVIEQPRNSTERGWSKPSGVRPSRPASACRKSRFTRPRMSTPSPPA